MKEVIDKLWELLPKEVSKVFELANTPLIIPVWIVLLGLVILMIEKKYKLKSNS